MWWCKGVNVQISTRLQGYEKLWNVADLNEIGATATRSTCQGPAPPDLNIFIIYKGRGHRHHNKFYSLSLIAKHG